MLNQIEKFLSNYPNIIDLLVAIGTIGAVVSSLYFSKLSLKPKINASLYISQLWLPVDVNKYKVQENEDFISLSVCNKGIIPILNWNHQDLNSYELLYIYNFQWNIYLGSSHLY